MSSFVTPLAWPLFEGSSTSADVGTKWDCALNGLEFMFDTKYFDGRQRRGSIPLLKQQTDDTGEISERSLNPEDLARQAIESWHHGAGQTFLDRPTSDPYRFRTSKGVDPWTEAKLQLLHDTELVRSTTSATVKAVVAGARLYLLKGSTVEWTTDLTNWTSVTGLPATAPNDIASDGFNVYLTCGANGVYVTNTGTSAASQLVSSAVASDAVIGFVKGRLMLGSDNALYNITSTTVAALPTALFTHRTSSFRWKDFAAGKNAILAIGYAGDKTDVYRTVVKTDGSGLEVPVHAVPGLPDGELGRSIYGYLDVAALGTENGVRFCQVDDDGNLRVGELIETGSPVLCFEGQGRFIWFGLSDYDSVSTGLGRLDPTVLINENALAPAWASDLMATEQGDVTSVVTFLDVRLFTVAESGLWSESDDLVATGTIDSGLITHGSPDNKVAVYLGLSHEPLAGSVSAYLAANGGSFTSLGASSTADSTGQVLNAGNVRGETLEARLILARSNTDTTDGPEQTRLTLESNMAPGRGATFVVYLKLYDSVKDRNGTEVPNFDPKAKYTALVEMCDLGAPITYQDAGGAVTVFLDDYDFMIDKATASFFDGTFAAKLSRKRRRVS